MGAGQFQAHCISRLESSSGWNLAVAWQDFLKNFLSVWEKWVNSSGWQIILQTYSGGGGLLGAGRLMEEIQKILKREDKLYATTEHIRRRESWSISMQHVQSVP